MVEVTRREREGTAGGFGLAACTELGGHQPGGLNCQQAAVPQGRTTEPEMPLLSIYPAAAAAAAKLL